MSERQQAFKAGSPTTSSTVNVKTGHKWSSETLATLFPLLLKSGVALTGSKTWDAGSVTGAAPATTTVTVTGAALGDFVPYASVGVDQGGLSLDAYVSAADTVTAYLQQHDSDATGVDLASTTLRVVVIPKSAFGL